MSSVATTPVPVALVLLAACSAGPDRGTSTMMVRDSAGVTIREFPGPLPTNGVTLEQVWTHGHDPGDYEFQSVFQGVLQDGTGAVVGDVGNAEVLSIPADGASFAILAASGQGPDEVRSPGTLVRFGMDSVWVQDRGSGKLLLFEGGALTTTVSTAGDEQLSFYLMPIGFAEDGTLLLNTGAYHPDFEDPWLDGTLARFDPSGTTADTVATYPMAPNRREPINPFAAYGQAVSAGRSFVTARTDIPELRWRRPDGLLFRIDRWRPEPVYPTEADLEDFLESMRTNLARVNPSMSDEELQDFVDDQLGRYALDRSTPKPLFYWMAGGDEGGLWLGEESDGGFWSRTYTVFTPDGRVGRADFGRPVGLVDVSDDHVLAIVRDDFDVQAVTVWRYRVVG